MRHLKSGKQLGRNSSHRRAMFRNMVVSLLNHESITTTDTKAKELRRYAEKVITLGKEGSLHARRRARIMLNDRDVLQKLFTILAERYKERQGGYTRIIKLGIRSGDSAPLSVIQLVQEEMKAKKIPASKKVKKEKAAPVKVAAPEAEAAAAQEESVTEEKREAVETVAEDKDESEVKTEEEDKKG